MIEWRSLLYRGIYTLHMGDYVPLSSLSKSSCRQGSWNLYNPIYANSNSQVYIVVFAVTSETQFASKVSYIGYLQKLECEIFKAAGHCTPQYRSTVQWNGWGRDDGYHGRGHKEVGGVRGLASSCATQCHNCLNCIAGTMLPLWFTKRRVFIITSLFTGTFRPRLC